MSKVVIRVENLGKRYRITRKEEEPDSLRQAVGRALASPFSYLREVTRPATEEETLWAVRNASFEVREGEVLGLIGPNGAGKSTLLKILARITEPTEGRAIVNGRIGSILEVGTGFHPELTGRENIYLNGAILGMRKAEIDRKLDEIVDFAGIEKFLDTPAKRYSSGMYVRLAFAVAAHLESEILLIDEVLAVGDAEFQRKCLGKIGDVAQSGRALLFVSHNMGFMARLSQRGVLLDRGQEVMSGDIQDVIDKYLESMKYSQAELRFEPNLDKRIQFRRLQILDEHGNPSTELDREKPFSAAIDYQVNEPVGHLHAAFMLDRTDGTPVCHSRDNDHDPDTLVSRSQGIYRSMVTFPGGLLNAGAYQVRLGLVADGQTADYSDGFLINLTDRGTFAVHGVHGEQRRGLLAIPLKWETEELQPARA